MQPARCRIGKVERHGRVGAKHFGGNIPRVELVIVALQTNQPLTIVLFNGFDGDIALAERFFNAGNLPFIQGVALGVAHLNGGICGE